MNYSKQDIETMDRVKRIKFINALSGVKQANLIGTISNDGKTNLAIFNSVMHLGSNPALLGFILRPVGEVERHTYKNILENKHYTINHVHSSFVKNAHYTAAKLDRDQSEFKFCGLTEEFIAQFKAPFVKESILKMGLLFVEALEIKQNGTLLVIGELIQMSVPEGAIDEDEDLNLEAISSVGVSGLNTYYDLKKIAHFPYPRPHEVPNFGQPE